MLKTNRGYMKVKHSYDFYMRMARGEGKRGTYEYKRREVNNFDLIFVKKKGGIKRVV